MTAQDPQIVTDSVEGETGVAPEAAPASARVRRAENRAETGTGGGTETTVSIMSSPNMRWFFDKDTGKWFVSYKLPNSNRRIFYEATGSQLDGIFGDSNRPSDVTLRKFGTLTNQQTFAGDISEVNGTGTFEALVKKVITLALDEGRLPSWAQGDDAVTDLLYIAVAESKSDEWLIGQISKLDSFKARFPGLKKIESLGLNTVEAVGAFIEFESGVKQIFAQRGRSPSGVTPELVGSMLAKGHSLQDVKFVFDGFAEIKKNKQAFDAFNQVLAARGEQPLGKKDQLDFLAGNSQAKLYRIWEEASFNRAAQDAGLDIGVKQAMRLARRTEGVSTYDQALEGLQNAAGNLLRFRGDIEFNRYDIEQDDLIDLSLGLTPRSGRSQTEVGRNIERALAASRAGVDGPRANRFRSFTSEGVPQGVSTTRSRTAT